MFVFMLMHRELILPELCLYPLCSSLFLFLPPRRLDHIRIPTRISKPSDFHSTFDSNQNFNNLTDIHTHNYSNKPQQDLTNLDPEIPDCAPHPNPELDFYSSSNSYLGRLPSRSSSISPQASVSVSNSALERIDVSTLCSPLHLAGPVRYHIAMKRGIRTFRPSVVICLLIPCRSRPISLLAIISSHINTTRASSRNPSNPLIIDLNRGRPKRRRSTCRILCRTGIEIQRGKTRRRRGWMYVLCSVRGRGWKA